MDSGKGVPQAVCLALHDSMRRHVFPLYVTTLMHSHEPRCGETEEHGKKAGGNMRGRQRGKNAIKAGPSHASGLALGAQFQILHWQFESQGRGSQRVNHVLVTLSTVLS